MRMTEEQVREHARKHGLPTALDAPIAPKPVAAPEIDPEPADAFTGKEKDLHSAFAADMRRRGVHMVNARTDQASTIEAGTPDFHLMFTGADGICRGAAIEFKVAGGKLSERQKECIAGMRAKRIPLCVAYDLKTAIDFARESLKA